MTQVAKFWHKGYFCSEADLEQGDLGLECLDDVLLLLDVTPQLFLQVALRLLLQTRLVLQLGYPPQGLILE